jgi:hypothetical protein
VVTSLPVKKAFGNRVDLYRSLIAALVGAGVSASVFYLYLITLAPTVMYYARPTLLDSAMLQTQVATLGITHPTGYPTYIMLTHLFTYLPFGDVAYRVNLASAVYGALGVLVLYYACLRFSRRVAAAAVAALAFGVGPTYWSQAVIAEVYTMNVLFVGLILLALLLWRDTGRDRYLVLSAFLMGLSLSHHLTSGLLLPAGLLFVALVDYRKLLEWRLVLKGMGTFLVGLTPYLYLPIRASMNPEMNEADPTSPGRFWDLVSGGELTGVFLAYGPYKLVQRATLFGDYLLDELHWAVLAVAVIGALALVRRRAEAVLVGIPFLGWLFYALEYEIFDFFLYFIPVYLMLAFYVAAGIAAALNGVESLLGRMSAPLRAPAVLAVSVALLLVPLFGVRETYAEVDRSEDYRGREIVEAVAENAAPNATVLHHRSELWYLVLVEERRQDLTLIDPWYPSWHRYTDIVWPDDIDLVTSNLRWGTSDYTGVASAREAAKRGPVYILNQESAGPQNFYDAGFGTVHVEATLFELVPPDGEPYTRR